MTNLDSILKSRDITLQTKVCLVKAMVFPVFIYGCESWTVAGASRQIWSGPENMHGVAEKENYSKLQQRWGREVQTRLHEGTQSDHDFIQHLIFIQESVRKTRQLTFFGWPIHHTKSHKKSWEHGNGTLLLFLTPDNISLCVRSLSRTPGVCSK